MNSYILTLWIVTHAIHKKNTVTHAIHKKKNTIFDGCRIRFNFGFSFLFTVTGLLEHYKDPACVMFFEPALTQPLNRNFCFTLQQLCRSLIVSSTTYDGINDLTLPSTLKSYLKEYHYKQRVRVKRYDQ